MKTTVHRLTWIHLVLNGDSYSTQHFPSYTIKKPRNIKEAQKKLEWTKRKENGQNEKTWPCDENQWNFLFVNVTLYRLQPENIRGKCGKGEKKLHCAFYRI